LKGFKHLVTLSGVEAGLQGLKGLKGLMGLMGLNYYLNLSPTAKIISWKHFLQLVIKYFKAIFKFALQNE
jgi:hypothetical protein